MASDRTRSRNIAIFTRACWLAGFSLESVTKSCRGSGLTEAEIGEVVSIYIAEDHALLWAGIIERGAHLDRRAT